MGVKLSMKMNLLWIFLIYFILLDIQVDACRNWHYRMHLHKKRKGDPLSKMTFRLPEGVKPLHYDIYLHPHLQNGTYEGKTNILIEVLHETNDIVLHQKNLNITSTKLNTFNRTNHHQSEIELHSLINIPKLEMLALKAKRKIPQGFYNLTFEFRGLVRSGFYSSTHDNETRYIATSKFKPIYARLGYPCFDEPSFKAKFTIKLVHPSQDCYSALSNMNVMNKILDDPKPGLTTVTFAQSMPMSTYMSSFMVISDFWAVRTNATNRDGKKFPVTVYTRKIQNNKSLLFALDIGIKAIEYYMNLFEIDYPLPKLDMVAIPDFFSDGMENWGLLTFKERDILCDNQTSSIINKYNTVLNVARGLSHTWWSNLVTPSWWNDLWLNEGFATFMQYKCANAILPTLDFMDYYLTSNLHPVLLSDAKSSSHPIIKNVHTPNQITEIFDEISYNKGSALVRMMEHFIGVDKFSLGMKKYLKTFAYRSAKSCDYFHAMQDVVEKTDINVTSVMDTWLNQIGYPVINVERCHENNVINLTQKRFIIDNETNSQTWTIPITYITNKNSSETLVWFDKGTNKVTINLTSPMEWMKFNAKQIGYYRVNYEPRDWKIFMNVLRRDPKELSIADRTNLLDDAFNLASAGQLSYQIPMNMTLYIRKEDNVEPWTVIATQFEYIDSLLTSNNSSSKFKAYVRDLIDEVYRNVTWKVSENESPTKSRLRTTLLGLACSMNHLDSLEQAKHIFQSWIKNPKDIQPHPDIRPLVYYYGLSQSDDEADWNSMFHKFSNETVVTEKLNLLKGLSASRSTQILHKFIERAKDINYVRSDQFLTCLIDISKNPVGTSLVWDWVRGNWKFLVDRYTLNDRGLGELIPTITKSFATNIQLRELKRFFKKYPEAGSGMTNRVRAIENLSNNINWLSRYLIPINDCWKMDLFRLPKQVIPIHYDISLEPDIPSCTFKGEIIILIRVIDKRNFIMLHQKDLEIVLIELKNADDSENISVLPLVDFQQYEMFKIPTERDLFPGLYSLRIQFHGILQPNGIVGFHLSKYIDSDFNTRLIATAKLQPTYARRAYPCFDEPSFKADFTFKIIHPNEDGYHALSNMNIETTQLDYPKIGSTTVTFAKTPVPMSTYVTAFVVSDFVALKENIKSLDGRTIPISIYTTKSQKNKTSYSLNVAVEAMKYYLKFLQIDYPLPKLDMIAIPDLVVNGSENWALITFRESSLLCNNETSTSDKYLTTLLIVHELAHMWFGNLISLLWWSDLWLNEGFATYMQYKTADNISPECRYMDLFLTNVLHTVLAIDANLNSRPIVKTVSNPNEITEIFDEISYQKGSSLIRMMEDFIGTEIFFDGIRKYLNKFSNRNVTTSDLFEALQDIVKSPINDVTSIMNTWTQQMGYPVVKVRKTKETNTYILEQKRFLNDPQARVDVSESIHGYKWTIPITYITDKNSTPTLIWFDKTSPELIIDLHDSIKWIKFNVNQIGYYRVNYEVHEWEKLMDVLRFQHQELSPLDRGHLLDDAFNLASAEQLSYDIPMNMTWYLTEEDHDIPWYVAATQLKHIDTLISSQDVSVKFKTFVRDLVGTMYRKVTWTVKDTDDHSILRLRTTILDLACSMGHEDCLKQAREIFQTWINSPQDQRPHPDVRTLVYYYGMYYESTEIEWNSVYDKWIRETDANEKLKLMKCLSGTRSINLLKNFIDKAKIQDNVRPIDFLSYLKTISENPVGTNLIWDWFRSNWQFLLTRYTLNDRYLGKLVPAITKSFNTETKLQEMRQFFQKYPQAGAGSSNRLKALETVSNNIKWYNKNHSIIAKWLNNPGQVIL